MNALMELDLSHVTMSLSENNICMYAPGCSKSIRGYNEAGSNDLLPPSHKGRTNRLPCQQLGSNPSVF